MVMFSSRTRSRRGVVTGLAELVEIRLKQTKLALLDPRF